MTRAGSRMTGAFHTRLTPRRCFLITARILVPRSASERGVDERAEDPRDGTAPASGSGIHTRRRAGALALDRVLRDDGPIRRAMTVRDEFVHPRRDRRQE